MKIIGRLGAMREYIWILEPAPDTHQRPKNLKGTTQKLPFTSSLKMQQQKKLRLRVWAHFAGEYLYILLRSD